MQYLQFVTKSGVENAGTAIWGTRLQCKVEYVINYERKSVISNTDRRQQTHINFMCLCAVHRNIIIQYKPTKCTFSKLIF